ncbi:MAG: hypothetical protein CSA82_02105, partial [Actinobacteria bacterium]
MFVFSRFRALAVVGLVCATASAGTTSWADAQSGGSEDFLPQSLPSTQAVAGEAPQSDAEVVEKAEMPALPPATPVGGQNESPVVVPFGANGAGGVRGNSPFKCGSGYVYSVSLDGTIRQISPDSEVTILDERVPGDPDLRVNGLAIGKDGEVAYAYRRRKTDRAVDIYRFDAASGEWTRVAKNVAGRYQGHVAGKVAGGVQLSTGDYYFGGFRNDENGTGTYHFYLWRYTYPGSDVEFVGRFDTGYPVSYKGANGDLAFDAAGNLYILRHKAGKDVDIYTVKKEELANPKVPGKLQFSQNSTVPLPDGDSVNGIAFDEDGTIYLGEYDRIGAYDPADFAFQSEVTDELGGESVDLASCASPSTFIVKKDVVVRVKAGDQFVLTAKKNSFEIATATTTGDATGIQDESAGLFPVKNNQVLKFSEEIAPGSPSSAEDYKTTWSCTADGQPLSEGDGTSGEVLLPATPSVVVECTFKNEPITGSLVWEKVDKDATDTHLEGSEWTVEGGPAGATVDLAVTDCVADTEEECADKVDKDHRAGHFKVSGLRKGEYTVTETVAPAGYKLNDASVTKEIDGDGDFSLGKIVNEAVKSDLVLKKKVLDVDGTPLADASGWKLAAAAADANAAIDGGEQTTVADGSVPQAWTALFPQGADAQVTIKETLIEGWENTAISCTDEAGATVAVTQNPDNSGEGTLTVKPEKKLACEFTNQRIAGTVTWNKVDEHNTKLSGSEWLLEGPSSSQITVKDCTEAGQCAGTNDTNPAPGVLSVEGLKWGQWTLKETLPPAGYALSSDTTSFEITA